MSVTTLDRPGIVVDELPETCATCGHPMDSHVDAHPYAVGDFIAGNATCAHHLYCRLHRLCVLCGTPLADVCGHQAALAAEVARAPQILWHAPRRQP